MEYKATLDLASKIITGIVTILFLGIIGYNIWQLDIKSGNLTHFGVTIFLTMLLVSIYGLCYLYRPIKYIVDKDKIIIKRPIKDLTLDIKRIKDAFLTKKESMRWTIRTFGNGGLFGYFGKFNNGTFGDMTWYATKRNNYTILETVDNEKIILTPDDIEMVKKIRKLIGK